MSKNHKPVMEEIIVKLRSGAISTYTELESIVTTSLLTTDEKDDILEQYMNYRLTGSGSGGSGGSWGASSTLPASNAPVTKTVTGDTVVIPASLHYSINVIDGAGISWGGNDLPLSGYVDYPPRVDGQAYPEVTIIVAVGTTILVSYQPL